jgi:hypothetical protein
MTILLTNLTIWDGEAPSRADAILINGARIVALGATDELQATTTIDCPGLTALPGLIDAHVHMELDPDQHVPPTRTDTSASARARMVDRAAAMLDAGITTARDLGGGAWLEFELRDRIRSGEIRGPRLLCAGQPVTSPSGHCHFWGGEAASAAEAGIVIDRQVSHGADLIKVMATGPQGPDPPGAERRPVGSRDGNRQRTRAPDPGASTASGRGRDWYGLRPSRDSIRRHGRVESDHRRGDAARGDDIIRGERGWAS